jgi:hypothetical protein
MTTNADAIAALVQSKQTLQSQCDSASGSTLTQLVSSIHNISGEIGALEAAALDNAAYVPATDPFNQATADAQGFLTTLNHLKTAFAALGTVAKALDSVINLIKKLAL